MKVVIIEDENLAARRLENMVKAADPTVEIVAMLESVEDSVLWFSSNPHPDLIFLDIHLEDDLSFSIFEKVKINSPIIFTTAFDEYAIRAFKFKSIDYLLKPIVQDELINAIEKYKTWDEGVNNLDISSLFDLIQKKDIKYRERYSVAYGQKIKSFLVDEIAYFYSSKGDTYAVLHDKNQYPLDYSLDTIASELNPVDFFRINRQYLIGHKCLKNVLVYPKSHLKLEILPTPETDVFVSIDKVTPFKRWFGE